MTILSGLMLLVQIALLYVSVCVYRELCRIKEIAGQKCTKSTLEVSFDRTIVSHSFKSINCVYAIWCWRGSHWELDLASVPVGYEPGKHPSFSGSFLGQRVKTHCTQR